MIKRAVVTGATGIIGSALVQILHEYSVQVYALCHPDSLRIKNVKDFAEIVESPLSEYDSAVKKIGKADTFFHLGWEGMEVEDRNNAFLQSLNVRHTLNAADAAHAMGCSVFVGAGSQAEYGRVNTALTPQTPTNPETCYGAVKLCAGQLSRLYCEQKQMRHVWARILSVYGANDRENSLISYIISSLKKGERPSLTRCGQIWDYIYCDDVAKALMLLAEKGDGVYPVGSGEARELREYVEVIRDIINPDAEIGYGERPYGEHQIMYLSADITALKNDTGFIPVVSFDEGIRRIACV